MKSILARGGVEFLAVFLGIGLSLWIDDYQDEVNIKKEIKSSLNALTIELTDNIETLNYIIKRIDYNISFTERLLETKNLFKQDMNSKDSIWNANIIPLGNKLYLNAYNNMLSSGLIYKVDDKNLLYDIQTIYEYNITLFEWWVDYETKFIEHIDKYIFKNLALNKTGANWELNWENKITIEGIQTIEFQNIIIGNRANREILKDIAEQLIVSKNNLLKGIKSFNNSIWINVRLFSKKYLVVGS